MCLAVPARIVDLQGTSATVTIDGVERVVDVSLVEDPQVGDYVLLHAGFAIEKWDEQAVQELEAIQALEQGLTADAWPLDPFGSNSIPSSDVP